MWNMPQAALFLSFTRTCQCMERQSSEARVLGGWSVLAGRRKRQLWGQTEALVTLCFLIGDLGRGVGSIVPEAEEKC